jgi:flagellar basal-body rod protein FlgB
MALFVNGLLDRTFEGLSKTLDLTWRRNEAIVSNIANAETPQYRAVDLNFSNELQRAFSTPQKSTDLLKTNSKHIDTSDSSGSFLTKDFSGATKADGNNVDIDIQMGRLAYNSGRFSTAANALRKQLSLLKNALRDSR